MSGDVGFVPPDPTAATRAELEAPYIRAMSRLLLAGVVLSASILVIGLVDLLVRGPAALNTNVVDYTFTGWLSALANGAPDAIFLLGFVVLVLTPLARVLLSIVMFSREGDRRYVAMTLFVLAMLVVSALAGVKL